MVANRWTKAKKDKLLDDFIHLHPEAARQRTELCHQDGYQLLVAVMLSAQCTDDRVNMVTPALFARYPDFASMARGDVQDIETLIKSCGLYHNKAINLQAMAQAVIKNGGQLPQSVEGLTALPGVGRKTANVVMAVLWDIPALAIDTHVGRVATRLGLAEGPSPEKIEKELSAHFPKSKWNLIHRLFIWHGRKICAARKPSCQKCPAACNCRFYQEGQALTSTPSGKR